jgi:RNA polymerase sigma-70 factor, ECF subfamily
VAAVSELTGKREPGLAGPADDSAEESLVRACQAGSVEAFDRFVHLYQNRVYGLAYHLVRDHDEAEDIAQEAFISCYRHIGEFRFESRVQTWLYRVTINRVKNRWKYDQRRQRDKHVSLDEVRSPDDPSPAADLPAPGPDPRRQAEGRQIGRILSERLGALPMEFREVIVLRFVQGLEYEEISRVLGCPIGTVKSRINRARRQLRETMRDVL